LNTFTKFFISSFKSVNFAALKYCLWNSDISSLRKPCRQASINKMLRSCVYTSQFVPSVSIHRFLEICIPCFYIVFQLLLCLEGISFVHEPRLIANFFIFCCFDGERDSGNEMIWRILHTYIFVYSYIISIYNIFTAIWKVCFFSDVLEFYRFYLPVRTNTAELKMQQMRKLYCIPLFVCSYNKDTNKTLKL
jgi:hypothetical protein